MVGLECPALYSTDKTLDIITCLNTGHLKHLRPGDFIGDFQALGSQSFLLGDGLARIEPTEHYRPREKKNELLIAPRNGSTERRRATDANWLTLGSDDGETVTASDQWYITYIKIHANAICVPWLWDRL